MKLTHYGHSAVLVELCGKRILIDPGCFSTEWHDLRDLDAICITHRHLDHVDPEYLPTLVSANPQAKLFVQQEVPLTCALPQMINLVPGQNEKIGEASLSAVGGKHAIIHKDIPRIGNIGFLITAESEPVFFHPGDSIETIPEGVDVLGIPFYAPWAAVKETIDFVRAVKAPMGFPIHDRLLSEFGFDLILKRLEELTSIRIYDLRSGKPLEVSSVLD